VASDTEASMIQPHYPFVQMISVCSLNSVVSATDIISQGELDLNSIAFIPMNTVIEIDMVCSFQLGPSFLLSSLPLERYLSRAATDVLDYDGISLQLVSPQMNLSQYEGNPTVEADSDNIGCVPSVIHCDNSIPPYHHNATDKDGTSGVIRSHILEATYSTTDKNSVMSNSANRIEFQRNNDISVLLIINPSLLQVNYFISNQKFTSIEIIKLSWPEELNSSQSLWKDSDEVNETHDGIVHDDSVSNGCIIDHIDLEIIETNGFLSSCEYVALQVQISYEMKDQRHHQQVQLRAYHHYNVISNSYYLTAYLI
jgi:hypothetical protein